ncbi:5-dehydro-4-deoxy-D-glucuronate isomerase [Anaerococcus lactolyticus]|uniref:5-dehydro-4-deoxy-D-glucuronate isomerase n=1 Tax=Anaerococcus lactolyticus TaxID=33032 RepID=UPI0023F1231B|nr:5-dehydro-4-deoxy-D-glucuronate isomerase [Anaerococcus lactolyticus]
MDIRYSANPNDVKKYNTEELRKEFLIQGLYKEDQVVSVYSHVDRMVVLGICPVHEQLPITKGIDVWKEFGTSYFLERREAGVFNIGGKGKIIVDGTEYVMNYKDCLYISKESKDVKFISDNPDNPARFYLVSAPAHKVCKTTYIPIEKANKRPMGDVKTSNKRTINQFIHPDVIETCQLSMGMTSLEEGSVWNSMPAHTHERRMEIYTYFEIPENNSVFHFMGQPTETRHLAMQNYEAVISPSWSIHCGCGTSNYTFIWAMGGENQVFDDMDNINIPDMR